MKFVYLIGIVSLVVAVTVAAQPLQDVPELEPSMHAMLFKAFKSQYNKVRPWRAFRFGFWDADLG